MKREVLIILLPEGVERHDIQGVVPNAAHLRVWFEVGEHERHDLETLLQNALARAARQILKYVRAGR